MTSPLPAPIAEELQRERAALERADKHIIEGAQRLQRQRLIVLQLEAKAIDFEQAQRLSAGLQATLAEWGRHRNLILHRIDHLERTAGK